MNIVRFRTGAIKQVTATIQKLRYLAGTRPYSVRLVMPAPSAAISTKDWHLDNSRQRRPLGEPAQKMRLTEHVVATGKTAVCVFQFSENHRGENC
jgi:hypothetical protein